MTASVLTIGHSTRPVLKLINLLRQHSVTAIADVRSQPYSRMNPQFNREPLKDALKSVGVAYVFLGRELGARSEDRSCYIDGKVQYDRLAQTDLFQQGLARVIDGAARHRIALLCAEKDPLTCHRTILVVRQLVARGLHASHILDDGRIEEHEDALERLLKEEGIPSDDFFKSRQALLDEAYAKRGNAIAYVEKSSATESAPERFAL
jgi:uncharacterized protein (DUF488 family)